MSSPYATETTRLLEPVAQIAVPHTASHDGDEVVPPSPYSTPLNFRIAATMFSFMVTGIFNGSIGVLLDMISENYGLTDFHVSFLFLCGPIGYLLASPFNASIHSLWGQRGIAIIGPLLHTLAAVGIATRPSFPFILLAFVVNGMGTGMVDGSWCAWAGGLERANLISGLLHGSYSIGVGGGVLALMMFITHIAPWDGWYQAVAVVSMCELIILATAFIYEDAARYRQSSTRVVLEQSEAPSKDIFKHEGTWVSAAYFLIYVGIETAISGWAFLFMARYRHADKQTITSTATGFWVGMTVGRLTLGYVSDRIGVRRAVTIYLSCAIGLFLLFTLVNLPVVSITTMACAGFVMGPLFPSGVVVLSELLPKELHVAAVSFIACVGQVGGALLPFGIGAAVEGLGLGVFPWVILVFTCIALYVWIMLTQLESRSMDRHEVE